LISCYAGLWSAVGRSIAWAGLLAKIRIRGGLGKIKFIP
jgi:hypothetical protein